MAELGEAQTMALDDHTPVPDAIVAVNSGSSTLKLTIFSGAGLRRVSAATVDRVGLPGTRLSMGNKGPDQWTPVQDGAIASALDAALDALQRQTPFTVAAAGHRVVHGGMTHRAPVRVSAAVVGELHRLEPLDPIHMPAAIALIHEMERRYPDAPQIACFDTAFHRSMPAVAQRYPLPRQAWEAGIRRYGFHGLSCESIMTMLQATDPVAAQGRILIAHLGNGASITAVRDGRSVDTTMGFSPVGGLMMGTRSGDLDPSVVTFLARTGGCDADALERVVSRESGLLGVSRISSDMRDLLGRKDSADARDAVNLFCYTARKHLGALAAALGGLDTIVFTGGIGEHAAPVRAGICDGLDFLGVRLDTDANTAGRAVISAGSAVTVRVMQTDEDLMIATHVRALC